jgi:hypothetical protein
MTQVQWLGHQSGVGEESEIHFDPFWSSLPILIQFGISLRREAMGAFGVPAPPTPPMREEIAGVAWWPGLSEHRGTQTPKMVLLMCLIGKIMIHID